MKVEGRRNAHAISNPTLVDIEKRWEVMPPQEQADLWMSLRERMKTNWAELTLQEKKAGTLFGSCRLRSVSRSGAYLICNARTHIHTRLISICRVLNCSDSLGFSLAESSQNR